MTTPSFQTLEEIIRHAREDWLVQYFAPPSEEIGHIRRTLEDVTRLAVERLGGDAPDVREPALVKEYERHPVQVKAFLQALGGTRTAAMLLMAWRVIQGMEIKTVYMEYLRRDSFRLRVILGSPYSNNDEEYESPNINDFSLLRHFAVMEINHKPVFDGFYPLRVRK